MSFGSEFECLALESRRLAWDVLQKSTYAEIGFLMIPDSIVHIRWIFMAALGHPQVLRPARVMVTRRFLDANTIEAET